MKARTTQISIEEIESLIRKGQTGEARLKTLKLLESRVPVEARFQLAAFCRRLSMPLEALKLLKPIIHPVGKVSGKATVKELAEYAAALEKVGANQEAVKILSQLDAKEYPDIHLFRSFSFFAQWDYKLAIPELETFLKIEGLEEHKRLIGLSNYAAALVYEKDTRADGILAELLRETTSHGYQLALGYCHLLMAENAVYSKDWETARFSLSTAKSVFGEESLLEKLLVEKWEAILSLYQDGPTEGAKKAVAEIKARARKFRHWETLRNCDYHLAIITREEKLLDQVYYGTSYPKLRERLEKEVAVKLPFSDSYIYGKPLNTEKGRIISLPLKEIATGEVQRGELLGRLLNLLFSDFYRPFRLAEIHAALFPDEFFNPVTSPNKIYQVIFRFKAQLEEHQIPFELEEFDNAYRLRPSRGYAVQIPINLSEHNQKNSWKEMLLNQFPDETHFSLAQSREILGVNERTLQRLFNDWIAQGILKKTGKARNTRYFFTLVDQTKKAA